MFNDGDGEESPSMSFTTVFYMYLSEEKKIIKK